MTLSTSSPVSSPVLGDTTRTWAANSALRTIRTSGASENHPPKAAAACRGKPVMQPSPTRADNTKPRLPPEWSRWEGTPDSSAALAAQTTLSGLARPMVACWREGRLTVSGGRVTTAQSHGTVDSVDSGGLRRRRGGSLGPSETRGGPQLS